MKPRKEASLTACSSPLQAQYMFLPRKEMQTFIRSRRKKSKAHEHKANSGVPFCPVPINRLVRAPLPLGSRASKDSSGLHEQPLPPRPSKGHVFFLPSSAPRRSFAAPSVFPGSAPPRCRPIAPRDVARPRPSGPGPPPLFSRLPLSACALPANRVAAADWWPRRSQSEGGTSR